MMQHFIRSFFVDECGATSIEYALIAVIVSLSLIAGASEGGFNLIPLFEKVRDTLADASS